MTATLDAVVLVPSSRVGKRVQIERGLAPLQHQVKGYIEQVTLDDGTTMIVNEEGRLMGLPVNETASLLAKRVIVGPAVLLGPVDEYGEYTDFEGDVP
jgi:hypothetical protein